jgi:hypothetical protein
MSSKFKLVFSNFLRSLHQLWLEVTGTFLLVFGGIFGYYALKEYGKLEETTENIWGILGAAGLSVLTFGFGIHSFWKSRKLR